MGIRSTKKALKAWLRHLQAGYAQRFRAYGRKQLVTALRDIGLRPGDAVMLHSSFSEADGFRGSIDEFTDALLEVLGSEGHLLMVSMPYRDSAYAYVKRLKRFDVRHTPSMMGLVSEKFRRRVGVLRSLHPTHPILVHGPLADWFIEGHNTCLHPCGPQTPFDRLLQVDGKALFFNAELANCTFFHHLEHLVAPQLPFAVYTQEAFDVPVVDQDGHPSTVRTHVYEPSTIVRRRFPIFEGWLRKRGLVRTRRLGPTTLELIRVRDTVDCVMEKALNGEFFFDMSGVSSDPAAIGAGGQDRSP